MAVPKSKVSKSRIGKRQSQKKISKINIAIDPFTGNKRMQHHICLKSGFYNGKKIRKYKKCN